MTYSNAKLAVRATALSGLATLAFAGVAMADSIDTTGPNSSNSVSSTIRFDSSVNNNNDVTVTNSNNQNATTGNATVSGNTTAGDALSGNALNANEVSTSVAIDNGASTVSTPGSGGGGGGSVGGNGGSGGAPGMGGGTGASSANPGFGAGGGAGVSTLPGVGCTVVCDVSALRSSFKPATPTHNTSANNQTRNLSRLMMGIAGLLSLVGAGGSALATRRAKALG